MMTKRKFVFDSTHLKQPPGKQAASAAESPHYSRHQGQFWGHMSYSETRRQKGAHNRNMEEWSVRQGQLCWAHFSTDIPSPKWNNYFLLPLFIVPLILPCPTLSGYLASMISLVWHSTPFSLHSTDSPPLRASQLEKNLLNGTTIPLFLPFLQN